MYTRRQMLTLAAPPAALAAAAATLRPKGALACLRDIAGTRGEAADVACEEALWAGVQRAFAVDRSLVNLNNGGVSPSPVAVQDAMRRYLEFSNQAPVHTMWRVLEPQRETVRRELAHIAGCDAEELAITRNTSEGMEACQTGLLIVRHERIGNIWPLMAAPEELDGNIRKFEEIATHPAANALGVGEALAFHRGLGPERKFARLCYLRDRWAKRLAGHPRVRLHTSLLPRRAGAIATVEIAGLEAAALAEHLWSRHRIIVAAISHPSVQGIRVAPSVYTTIDEIDRFAGIMENIAEKGLPA